MLSRARHLRFRDLSRALMRAPRSQKPAGGAKGASQLGPQRSVAAYYGRPLPPAGAPTAQQQRQQQHQQQHQPPPPFGAAVPLDPSLWSAPPPPLQPRALHNAGGASVAAAPPARASPARVPPPLAVHAPLALPPAAPLPHANAVVQVGEPCVDVAAAASRRRSRHSLPRGGDATWGAADAAADDAPPCSQEDEQELVGWARDSPNAKRLAATLPCLREAGSGASAAAFAPRPSALCTLLGLSSGGAKAQGNGSGMAPPSTVQRVRPRTAAAPPAWEQWIAAGGAGPVADGGAEAGAAATRTMPLHNAAANLGPEPSVTPGLGDGGDGAVRRISAPTPGSLAAALAAAAAGTSGALQHNGRTTGGASTVHPPGGGGLRRQAKRAALLALLERIETDTAEEGDGKLQAAGAGAGAPVPPSHGRSAPVDVPAEAAPVEADAFAVDPRDLAALLEAAAQPAPAPPTAAAPVALALQQHLPACAAPQRAPLATLLEPNGAAPAAPALQTMPVVAQVPSDASAADDDDVWGVPAPAPGVPLRVTSVADEHPPDGGGPARRVRLVDERSGAQYIVWLRDDWADTPCVPGDMLCVAAEWSPWGDATLHSRDARARAVLHPSMLLTATAVGASLSCLRRAVLSDRLGGGAATEASLFGSATHALFQAALQAPHGARAPQLAALCSDAASRIVASSRAALAGMGSHEAKLRRHLADATPHIVAWVAGTRGGGGHAVNAPRPRGAPDAYVTLDEVLDIEEMVWAPRLGLKGQLDATVVARFGLGAPPRRVPLELKSGRFRDGREHGAQLSLYTLLLAERYGGGISDALHTGEGLLHYSAADSRGAPPATLVVAPDSREVASLLHARNLLAAALARAAGPTSQLPPITAPRADCARCFKQAECAFAAAALEHDDGSAAGVGELFAPYTAQLSASSAAFLRHWDAILGAEVALLNERAAAPWRDADDVRRRGGACLEVRQTAACCACLARALKVVLAYTPQGLRLRAGAASLASPREIAALAGDADASTHFEYDFLLGAAECDAAARAATASAAEDALKAAGTLPSTLCEGGADDSPMLPSAVLPGCFRAGDRVLLSIAAPAGAPATDIAVLARAVITAVTTPPDGAPASTGVVLTLRTRRPLRVPTGTPEAAAMRPWRIDRDDGAGLVTKMRATLWAMVMQQGPCRLRELVAELAPPRRREPAPAPRPDAAGAAAAMTLAASLNSEQAAALDAVLRAADFVLLRGLPGTGKTATLVAAVAALVARGASVLLACHTHSALDNALSRLLAAGVPGVLRLGDVARVAPPVRPACLGSAMWPADSAEAVAACADAARVVGVTCHGVGSSPALARRRFHVAVLDEAAQVPLPLALAPLSRADAFLLVGDPAQLPPLWASPAARAGGGEESLFVRLATAHPGAVTQLSVQYRMAADVQLLANTLVYGGALRCGSETTATRVLALPLALPPDAPNWVVTALAPTTRVLLLDTDALGAAAAEAQRPLRNPGEAALAATLVSMALSAGAPPGALALMTPYNAQVAALGTACAARHLPPDSVEIITVDRSQGRDLPAVVLSCVRTTAPAGDDARGGGSLLEDGRRLCVALTRAQGKLIIVASVSQLRAAPLTCRLVELCDQRGWLLRLPPDALATL